ncbi:hypothetical protein XENTR_v10004061 [Xenopus tropicalis]|nr:hypothetical protein XENTR_v10004061 [Xenopus tropicalis]KAE8576120.1 hypothetical protein XENTR_v10004061 [Xenopus tropicalis]
MPGEELFTERSNNTADAVRVLDEPGSPAAKKLKWTPSLKATKLLEREESLNIPTFSAILTELQVIFPKVTLAPASPAFPLEAISPEEPAQKTRSQEIFPPSPYQRWN